MTSRVINNQQILFQKLGTIWFIFSEINNDIVYSSLPDGLDPLSTKLELYSVIEDHMEKVANSTNKFNIGRMA